MDEGSSDQLGGKAGLNALADEIMNMLCEVKKRNRKVESQNNTQMILKMNQINESIPVTGANSVKAIDDSDIAKRYHLNLDLKKRMEQMTDIER